MVGPLFLTFGIPMDQVNNILPPAGLDAQSVMYKLGSIEAQLSAINEKLDKKEREQDKEIDDLRKDVGKLKDWRTAQMAIAGAISFVIGVLTKVVPWQNLF